VFTDHTYSNAMFICNTSTESGFVRVGEAVELIKAFSVPA
jgi:hypothetical protein